MPKRLHRRKKWVPKTTRNGRRGLLGYNGLYPAMHTSIGKTRLELTEGDIAAQTDVDAVVTAAHWDLLGGQGTDGISARCLHRRQHGKAGPALLEECRTLGACPIGGAVITRDYNLPAPYVIHAVGPVFETGDDYETDLLTGAYQNALRVAAQNHLRRVAFPSIGTGAFVWPLRVAAPIALAAIVKFLQNEPHALELVRLVLYKDEQPEAISIYEDALQKLLAAV